MFRLNEAMERIDSSFQFALAGTRQGAGSPGPVRRQLGGVRGAVPDRGEQHHHPPGRGRTGRPAPGAEGRLLRRGEQFFALPRGSPERHAEYFGRPATRGCSAGSARSRRCRTRSSASTGEHGAHPGRGAGRRAGRSSGSARRSGLLAALVAGVGWYLSRTILGPIRAVTEAAHAIGGRRSSTARCRCSGRDELGRLAVAFNAMTRQFAATAGRTSTGSCGPSGPPRRPSTRSPTRCSSSTPAGGRNWRTRRPSASSGSRRRPARTRPRRGSRPSRSGSRSPTPSSVQRAYQPEEFDQAVSFRLGGEDRTYLPQVRPIRDPRATRSARPSCSTT